MFIFLFSVMFIFLFGVMFFFWFFFLFSAMFIFGQRQGLHRTLTCALIWEVFTSRFAMAGPYSRGSAQRRTIEIFAYAPAAAELPGASLTRCGDAALIPE